MIKNSACCANWENCCPNSTYVGYSVLPTVIASLAMAVGSMSDAFLYAYLPVHSASLGLGAMALGMILSINKFVRFFFNRWVNALVYPFGLRNILLAALLMAAFTSLSYQFNMPLWLWLISRTAWGAAYAMFRFASVQYADLAHSKAKAIGITTALRELGPITAYFVGPLLLAAYGPQITFSAASALSLAFLPFVFMLPLMKSESNHPQTFKFQKGNWLDGWTFISAFLVDGLIVVAMSLLINFKEHQNTSNILWITASFIALRRALQLMVAPVSGWLVQRLGYKRAFMASALAFLPGIALLVIDFPITGILLLSLAAVVNNVTLPLFALHAKNTADNYNTFTKMATAKDMGGAIGALTGVWLIQHINQQFLFIGIFALTAIVISKIKNSKFVNQHGTHSAHS